MSAEQALRDARQSVRSQAYGMLQSDMVGRQVRAFVCTREGEPVLVCPSEQLISDRTDSGYRLELTVGDRRIITLTGILTERVDTAARARLEKFLPGQSGADLVMFGVTAARTRDGGKDAHYTGHQWRLPPAAWFGREDYIIDHMNDDHVGEMAAMCRYFHQVDDSAPTMLAVDPEGLHIRSALGVHYFPFRQYCATVKDVANETIRLARKAMAG